MRDLRSAREFQRHGFTLIELLVGTLLVGVLGSMAYTQYSQSVHVAQQRNAQIALKAIASAEAVYALRNHGQLDTSSDFSGLINAGLLSNSVLSGSPYTFSVISSASGSGAGGGLAGGAWTGGGRAGVTSPPNSGVTYPTTNGNSSAGNTCLAMAVPSPQASASLQTFYIDATQKIYTSASDCEANPYAAIALGRYSTGQAPSSGGGHTSSPPGGGRTSSPPGGGYGNCFVAGTPVMTPAGERAIDKVKPGDVVYAADPASYALVPEKVADIEVKTADVLLEVALGNGTKFRVTPVHRFYAPSAGKFKEIGRFKVGDRVSLLKLPEASGLAAVDPAGETWYPAMEWDIRIASIKKLPLKATKVYNLHMGGRFHDYLVDGVLVHNVKSRGSGSF